MALKQSFFDLLEHIGTTCTTSDLFHANPDANIVAMRHDVDHDLDLALEMAHHEWKLGYKATYFLLHTEAYWNDPDFSLKIKQFSEYGHEVGLHVNAYSPWVEQTCDNPNKLIIDALEKLRSCDVHVTGVCAHGDKLCYKHGFINYWMWEELRGDSPELTEDGMSAEGIRVNDEAYQISYPRNHSLARENGDSIPLWNLSMKEHGIEYDAAHMSQDSYWSDSGGNWTRTGSPMESDLSKGKHQVLVHPWWWRGEPKSIFVMSPARSGSKWLANFIDKATSAVGLHEWTLNHVREGNEFLSDNQTSRNFLSLLNNPHEITTRLKAARAHRKLLKRDTVECNVYLEGSIPEFMEVFGQTDIVQLFRNPVDVTRSILNRHWYASTEDHVHRTDGSKCWRTSTQLERACRYVKSANEAIGSIAAQELEFSKMTLDQEYLIEFFTQWGIVVHPLLASQIFKHKLNENQEEPVPAIEKWPTGVIENVEQFFRDDSNRFPRISESRDVSFRKIKAQKWRNCDCTKAHKKRTLGGLRLSGSNNQASTCVFFGSKWNTSSGGGVKISKGLEYLITVSCKKLNNKIRVYVLYYNTNGDLLQRLQIATLTQVHHNLNVVLKPHVEASSFSIGFYVDKQTEDWSTHIRSIGIQQRKLPDQYDVTEMVCPQLHDSSVDVPVV